MYLDEFFMVIFSMLSGVWWLQLPFILYSWCLIQRFNTFFSLIFQYICHSMTNISVKHYDGKFQFVWHKMLLKVLQCSKTMFLLNCFNFFWKVCLELVLGWCKSNSCRFSFSTYYRLPWTIQQDHMYVYMYVRMYLCSMCVVCMKEVGCTWKLW